MVIVGQDSNNNDIYVTSVSFSRNDVMHHYIIMKTVKLYILEVAGTVSYNAS